MSEEFIKILEDERRDAYNYKMEERRKTFLNIMSKVNDELERNVITALERLKSALLMQSQNYFESCSIRVYLKKATKKDLKNMASLCTCINENFNVMSNLLLDEKNCLVSIKKTDLRIFSLQDLVILLEKDGITSELVQSDKEHNEMVYLFSAPLEIYEDKYDVYMDEDGKTLRLKYKQI